MSVPATNIFGPIVTMRTVEQGVASFLRLWFLDCLDEIERREGYAPGEIERPRSVPIHSDLSKWSEEQLPCLLVLSSGLAGPPERMGDGSYTTVWRIAIGAVVKDVDEDATRKLSSAYIAATRLAVMQHQGLGGLGRVLRWIDESYDDTPPERRRSMAVGRFVFDVQIDRTIMDAGPVLPRSAPIDPALPPPAVPTTDPGPWPGVKLPAVVGVTPKNPTEVVTK